MWVFPVTVKGNPITSFATQYAETILYPLDWSHRIEARGGFISATFSLIGPEYYLQRWLSEGLGRHIVRYDHQAKVMWEGYVHSLTLTLPGRQISRSLENLANGVQMVYTWTDWDDCTEVSGEAIITSLSFDRDSQNLHGVARYVGSVGQATTEMADAEGNMHLAKFKQPTREVRALVGNDLFLSVELRGYGEWFRKRYYTNISAVGTTDASIVIRRVANGTGEYIRTNLIDTNTFDVQEHYSDIDQHVAYDVLNGIADKGDGTNLWNWSILEDRTFYYRNVPTKVDYVRYMYDPAGRVYTDTGSLVQPWQLRPDHFIRTPDVFAGAVARSTDFTNDPAVQYIYAVAWSENDPFAVNMEYREADSLQSKIASTSLLGIRL